MKEKTMFKTREPHRVAGAMISFSLIHNHEANRKS